MDETTEEKKKITVAFPSEKHREIYALQIETGQSVGSIIRTAVYKYLKEESQK